MRISAQTGRVNISAEIIRSKAERLIAAFSELHFLPLRIEWRFETDTFEYIGISPEFAVLDEGQTTPLYVLKITGPDMDEILRSVLENRSPHYEYKFERVED